MAALTACTRRDGRDEPLGPGNAQVNVTRVHIVPGADTEVGSFVTSRALLNILSHAASLSFSDANQERTRISPMIDSLGLDGLQCSCKTVHLHRLSSEFEGELCGHQ